MRVDDFDFELPPDRIALAPAEPRHGARLLVVRPHHIPELEDRSVLDLPTFLNSGDLLVLNDTRVIRARLIGRRISRVETPRIEILLHRRLDSSHWWAFAKPAKRLQIGDVVRFGDTGRVCLLGALNGKITGKGERGEVEIDFEFSGDVLDSVIEAAGEMPLPPYIASRRPISDADERDYQTLFAARDGAVAAPTAGLHFTQELFDALHSAGIVTAFTTLHVGAGTFQPVFVDDTSEHHMHAEWGEISSEAADRMNEARGRGGRIVAVGTTVARLVESAASDDGRIAPFSGETRIFITPGFKFRAISALLTNFHLPRSTLFMLVAAFSGLATMRRAYQHAIAEGYRFYSYGDASLLFPES